MVFRCFFNATSFIGRQFKNNKFTTRDFITDGGAKTFETPTGHQTWHSHSLFMTWWRKGRVTRTHFTCGWNHLRDQRRSVVWGTSPTKMGLHTFTKIEWPYNFTHASQKEKAHNDSHTGREVRKGYLPIWTLALVVFLRSMIDETGRPRRLSRSPCWKNSSVMQLAHCKQASQCRQGLEISAHLIAICGDE